MSLAAPRARQTTLQLPSYNTDRLLYYLLRHTLAHNSRLPHPTAARHHVLRSLQDIHHPTGTGVRMRELAADVVPHPCVDYEEMVREVEERGGDEEGNEDEEN